MTEIKIGGEKHPFQIGMYALQKVAKQHNKPGVEDFMTSLNEIEFLYDLAFEGVSFAYKIKGKKFKYEGKKFEFIGLLDTDLEAVTKISEIISVTFEKFSPEGEEGEKKQVGKVKK